MICGPRVRPLRARPQCCSRARTQFPAGRSNGRDREHVWPRRSDDESRGPDPRGYWKEIPGAKLYIFADKILNLNLNYESPEPSAQVVEEFLRKYLATAIPPFHVEFKRPLETPAESGGVRNDEEEGR